jgi:ATP-dependent Clp protease ATP-binding subunit ClpC
MPKNEFRFVSIIQTLGQPPGNDNYLGEALLFPEVSRYRKNPDAPKDDLRANLARLIEEDLAPLEIHRRRFSGDVELSEVEMTIDPPARSVAWRTAVTLRFDIVRWAHGESAYLAYVPALGIEIVAANAEELSERIPKEIRAHLLRTKAAGSLVHLMGLQYCSAVEISTETFTAEVKTPKQIARELEASFEQDEKKSVLDQVTTDLVAAKLPVAYEMDEIVARLAEVFSGRTPRSVLLVGKSGVGKTAAVSELVRRRAQFGLQRTSFRATSGARLVAGMSGFGMWQERCQQLWREAAKEKAILHLGNLIELMEVGKSVSSSQGIAGFLRPYIARGDLLVIAECVPEQIPVIERADPHLLTAFQRIDLEEPSPEKGRTILFDFAVAASDKDRPAIELEAIERLDQLHRRYATYSAYPGRPLRFLKNLLAEGAKGFEEGGSPARKIKGKARRVTPSRVRKTMTAANVTEAFSRETGLPLFLLEESIQLDLNATRRFFTERVVGQEMAVDLVVDLLAMVKTYLTRPRKPIASLLFIGPTGTGKTEMAKSLAEFLFQDRGRLLRFDMSEYADPSAVERLIGGALGGTANSEGLLTSKVREQPFAVILLDEIEKAHPQFLDLLLQVLGEGRLTDAAGRVADFCNAVVIMTSNLGAESFQRGVKGFATEDNDKGEESRRHATRHFLKEVRAFVRPELFNRLDRVVAFAALSEETVELIARRELERLTQRDGVKYRGMSIKIDERAATYLARKGYNSRYGARPLKRAIERELLAPLSENLNRHPAGEPLDAEVTLDADQLVVRVQPKNDPAEKRRKTITDEAYLADLTRRAAELRRDAQRLERSPTLVDLYNRIFRLKRLEESLARLKWKSDKDLTALAVLPRLQRTATEAREYTEKIFALETDALMGLYGRTTVEREKIIARLTSATSEWEQLLLGLYALRHPLPDRVTLAVYGESAEHLFGLARAYFGQAVVNRAEIELFQLSARQLARTKIEKPARYLTRPDAEIIGLIFNISGAFALPRYADEQGLHLFATQKITNTCIVQTSEVSVEEYKTPAGLERRGGFDELATGRRVRRIFQPDRFIVEDKLLDKRFNWSGGEIDDLVARAIDEWLVKATHSIVSAE